MQLVEANLDCVIEEFQLLYDEYIKDPAKAGSPDDFRMDSDGYRWQANQGKLHDPDYDVFRFFAGPENLIIDAGANSGYSASSIWAAGSDASVWSFEALSVHRNTLEKIKSAFPDRYDFKMVGLGDKEGQLTLLIPAINNTCVTGLATASDEIYWPSVAEYTIRAGGPSAFKGNRTPKLDLVQVTVPVTTLDAVFAAQKPKVRGQTLCAIKIDVEGVEPLVIEGARQTLEEHKPLLLIESGQHHPGLPETLRDLGYVMAFYLDDVLKESEDPDSHVNAFFWHASHEQSYRNAGLLPPSQRRLFFTFGNQVRRLKSGFSKWLAPGHATANLHDPANKKVPEGELPDTFCVMPWISEYVSTDGAISPCCEFQGETGNLKDQTLEQAWNGAQLAKVRKDMLAGKKLKPCAKCFDREKLENNSMRLDQNSRFSGWYEKFESSKDLASSTPQFPVLLDLRFSNLCNFSCRSCWHGSSSSWFTDGKAIGLTVSDKAEVRSFTTADEVKAQLRNGIEGLEELYFAGGEPMMMAEHFAVLELLIEQGRTDVQLRYNTNMSRSSFAGQSIFELWQKFNSVDVEASVDAAHEQGDYIRNGFKWEQFVANVNTLREAVPQASLTFGITVSALNILYLPALFRALVKECGSDLTDLNMHSLQDPEMYRTQVLPQPLKHMAEERLNEFHANAHHLCKIRPIEHMRLKLALAGVCSYMHGEDKSNLLTNFRDVTERLDSLRSQDHQAVLPELDLIWQ